MAHLPALIATPSNPVVSIFVSKGLTEVCIAGEATVKGYTKVIKQSGAYTEIANAGTDEKRCKE